MARGRHPGSGSSPLSVHEYTAFGARLTSALSFPELEPWRPPGTGDLRWCLDVHHAPPPPTHAAELLGEADYAGGAHMTLHRRGATWQLGTSDAGAWQLDTTGGRMHWFRTPGAREAVARYDAIGRVMPLMLHAMDNLCLHAAGLAVGDWGVVLVGPKGRGKSSLALACVRAGARLAGDDVAVVAPGAVPSLRPGAPFVRLRHDSARALELGADIQARATNPLELGTDSLERGPDGLEPGTDAPESVGGSKLLVPPAELGETLRAPVPLRAVYLLEVASSESVPARRARLTGPQAALAIVAQSTNARLLGGDQQAELLRRASDLASRVPVYTLHVARNLALIAPAARQLLEWLRFDGQEEPAQAGSGAWA